MSDIMHANNPTSDYMPEIDYTGQCQPCKLYHVVSKQYREDILQNGLVPEKYDTTGVFCCLSPLRTLLEK